MTEDERTKIILGLCDTKEKQFAVCKYDKGTQTYYADVEEALRRIPQDGQCVPVKKDDEKKQLMKCCHCWANVLVNMVSLNLTILKVLF